MMCLITFLASIVYVVFNGYSPEKVTVILLVCIYKILDSVADTFEGEFQKEERIDMSGKSEFYRIFFSILVLVVTVIITGLTYVLSGITEEFSYFLKCVCLLL